MKRNKAINVTKRDIRSAIVEDRNYCYHYYPENATTHIKQTSLGFDYNFKDLDLQNVSNWSHLTCSCRDSIGKYQEASYFTTKLKQMPSKVTDVGVGNVKAYRRRKAKRIYMPQTEERAIGTSINDYPKCHHFNEPTYRTTRNFVERAVNKKHLLNKKLSPFVRKKSNYTSPLPTLFRKHDLEHNVSTTLSIHNQVNASTQMDQRELEKSTKIKIFKELATNTELENGRPLKSEVELSVEVSRVLSNKLGTGSSLDSLVQHVYNLDKPCNATLSTSTIDPMENKLEREYRKIFSNQFKDCAFNNKISAANSDSLLRRFEALKRDMSLKGELKKNKRSKTSSPPNEPKYKDVSVDSDGASVARSDIKKIDSPISSDFSESHQKEKVKRKSNAKLQKSSYWRRSDVDCDHQTKGRFKIWGRKISADDGHHKKSKLKCSNNKKRSEASVKFSKLLKTKSSVKKEGKKFRFFKKKMKAEPISRTDVMTGRCEVREGMSVQIGKELLTQDYNSKAIQNFRLKYEDNLLYAWIRNFLTKSDHEPRNRSAKYSSRSETNYSSSFDIGKNRSSDTDVQFTTTATVTNNSSFQKVNKSSFINYSNQYIEAWMLTKTILDRLVKPKIYWNARTDKFNKKKNIDINKYCDCKDTNPKNNVPANNDDNIKEKITSKPNSIMIDISLGCMSDLIHQSFEMQSNEEVCKITDYETPRQSIMNILKQSFEKEKCNEIISEYCMKDNTNCRFNDTENLKKKKSSYRAGIFQDNEIEAPKTCHGVGIEIATQSNLGKWNYPVYDISTEESGDDLEGTVFLLPKTYKHSDVYLQKFYHNWNPLDLDLWCISDTNLQPSYTVNKDINIKSYSNMTDDMSIQYSTLVSSCETFRHCVQDKGKKALSKSHNNDHLSHNIGIRITPKDSLEVCKKRKLYSESNKGRWKHDELSISLSSSTKSKNHFKKFITLTPNKKRVTISNYEVEKESKPITKDNDLRKKNIHCLSSSYHVSDSIQAARKLSAKLEKKPTRQNISITATSSGITNRTCNQCDSSEVKCLKSASKDNVLNVVDSCITNWKRRLYSEKSSGEDRKNSEKINDTKSGFLSEYFKPSCRIKNKYHRMCRKFVADKKTSEESDKNCQNSKFYQEQSCPNLREQMKTEFKHCSITTDVQELSTLASSVEDKSCGAICGTDTDVSKKGKLIGLHLKKQPLRKNVSRACWTTGDKLESSNTSTVTTTKCSTKETPRMTCKSPPISPSVSKSLKKEIKNNTVQKELNNVDNKNKGSDDKIKNTPCVIRRNIEITPNTQSTSDSGRRICLGFDATSDDQSNDKSDCDFIEIVFKIRRKHGDDRAMVGNKKDSKDRIIKDNKTDLSGRDSDCNSKTKEVYLLQNESGNSALRRNSNNCMNVKILIRNCKNDELNKTSELTGSNISISSKRSVEKNQSISSETVNNYAYSIHKFTIDLTKSAKSNNSLKEKYAILHSNKGTVISETAFQKIDILSSNEVINNRSNENIKYNRKCNGSPKHKHHTNKIKNEKLYYSSATLRPERRHSLSKQMSNYKHLKNRVLQKIVDCAKDFNKGMKKEKRMRKRSNVMASLDYSNRNIFDQNVNRLSNEIRASTLYSHFLSDTGSYGYCNFDRPKSKVNDYLFTFKTKDRNKKINPSYSTSEYEKKKHTKILATKLGLTDTRKRQARRSVRNSDNCHRRFKNIKKPNHCFDNELGFLYDLDSCEFNSYLRHMDKEAIRTDESEQFQQSNIDNNINLNRLKINRSHKDVVCVSDERNITIVSSKYGDEKCISDECGLEETCNHRNETFDIFQLSEIKRAVFEMYNSKEISSKPESLKLPKFESDVENALI